MNVLISDLSLRDTRPVAGQKDTCTVKDIRRDAHTENCDIALAMFFYKQLAFVTALAMLLLQSQAAPAVYERQVCTAPDGTADDVAIGLCLHSRECQPAHQDVRQRRSLPMSKGGSRTVQAETTACKYCFKTRTREI